MAHVIGFGRRARETYPEAPRAGGALGALLQAAEQHTLIPNHTSDALPFVLQDVGVPLEVAFTNWTPNDVLVIDVYSIVLIDPEIGNASYSLTPAVNVGAGWQTVTPVSGELLVTQSSGGSATATTAVRLSAAPTVRLVLASAGSPDANPVLPILLRLSRYSGPSWIQGPDNTLV